MHAFKLAQKPPGRHIRFWKPAGKSVIARRARLPRRLRPNASLRVSVWLAVAMSALVGTRGLRAQASPRNTSPPIPTAQITQESPTSPPVIAGTDIRFYRTLTGDGLSQVRASQILQDDQGFMWFGTQYGLNRYDGYKFKVFLHDPT